MIDFTKPVETVNGRRVKILSTEAEGLWPIVGQFASTERKASLAPVRTWHADGTHSFGRTDWNLRNVVEDKVTYSYFGQSKETGISCYGGELDHIPPATSSCKPWKGILKITRRGDEVVSLEIIR